MRVTRGLHLKVGQSGLASWFLGYHPVQAGGWLPVVQGVVSSFHSHHCSLLLPTPGLEEQAKGQDGKREATETGRARRKSLKETGIWEGLIKGSNQGNGDTACSPSSNQCSLLEQERKHLSFW